MGLVDQAEKQWKTPHGMGGMDASGKHGGAGGGEFAKQANSWITPQVQDVKHSAANAANRAIRGGQFHLEHQVGMWMADE